MQVRSTWPPFLLTSNLFISLLSFIGESLFDTAVRETREETGVETEPVALLCFRHMHSYRWDTSDLYFTCLLRPLTSEINFDVGEIAACKWMSVSNHNTHQPGTVTIDT